MWALLSRRGSTRTPFSMLSQINIVVRLEDSATMSDEAVPFFSPVLGFQRHAFSSSFVHDISKARCSCARTSIKNTPLQSRTRWILQRVRI